MDHRSVASDRCTVINGQEDFRVNTIIACASRYGSTLEIGHWMADRLPWEGVDVYPVERSPEPGGYELVFLEGGF
jgi:hypothetical protein